MFCTCQEQKYFCVVEEVFRMILQSRIEEKFCVGIIFEDYLCGIMNDLIVVDID